jgi:hypothetical protein
MSPGKNNLLFFGFSMYLWKQDEQYTSPVFQLYVPLLAPNSGSGGRFCAHLKDSKKQDFQVYTNFHTSRSPKGCGFVLA